MPLHFTPPSNEAAVFPVLPQRERAAYSSWRAAAERAAVKNPGMNTKLYTDFLYDLLDWNKIRLSNLNNARQSGMNQLQIRSYEQQMNKYLSNHIKQNLGKYGPEGQQAWEALNKEKNGGGVLGFLTQNLWDDNGPKLGLIGGLIGLAAAFVTTKGGDFGWAGLLLFPLEMLIGAWAVEKGVAWYKERNGNSSPASPGPSPSPTPDPSLIPPLVQAKQQARPVTPERPTLAQLGQLPPQPLPSNPPASVASAAPNNGTVRRG